MLILADYLNKQLQIEKMKKFVFLVSCVFLYSSLILAQQDPQFSQNMFNKLANNPGFAGSKQAICATAIHRSQWMGLEGAPTTLNLSVDAGIPMINGGLGLVIVKDEIASYSNLGLQLSYAYRTELGNGQLGAGVSLGMFQSGLDGGGLRPSSPNDPALSEGSIVGSALDLGAGFYYNTQDAYIGVSTSHINEPTIEWESSKTHKMKRHYFLIAGYYYEINPMLSLNPSIYLKQTMENGQLDINTNIIYNNKIWGGVSYRRGEQNFSGEMVLLSGMNITDDLRFSIAYDLVFSNIGHNSLEFMLGYCFDIKYDQPISKYKNPRFL
jgi:type IX secretion system PorP/SprF family membrane protein